MADIWKVVTRFNGTVGGPGTNTLYFDGAATTASAANAAAGAFWTSYSPFMCPPLTWATDPQVEKIDVATGGLVSITAVTPVSGAGSSGTDPGPWANQGLLQLRTGNIVGRRELRGRIFLPAVSENSNTNGVPNASYKSSVDGFGATLIAAASASLVVYSKTHTAAFHATSATTWAEWAVLRSRRQ